jgi:hypothetical protein
MIVSPYCFSLNLEFELVRQEAAVGILKGLATSLDKSHHDINYLLHSE